MNITKRLITAAVLISIVSICVMQGGLLFTFLVSMAGLLCLSEMLTLKKIPLFSCHHLFALFVALCGFLSLFSSSSLPLWQHPFVCVAALTILAIAAMELQKKTIFFQKKPLFLTSISVSQILLTLPFIILIRFDENGLAHCLLCMCIVSVVDSCAYFTGKHIGRTPLSVLSPNKTLEGTIGGILCGILTGLLACYFLSFSLKLYTPIIIAIAAISPLGDLHESLSKRVFKTKDSSNLLPGHGGLYDRLDSHLFNLPIFYYLFSFLNSMTH